MIKRSITQTKAEWLALLDKVELGEEVTITRYGKPIAKLVKHKPAPRKLGLMKGQIAFLEGYDGADAEIEKLFTTVKYFQSPS